MWRLAALGFCTGWVGPWTGAYALAIALCSRAGRVPLSAVSGTVWVGLALPNLLLPIAYRITHFVNLSPWESADLIWTDLTRDAQWSVVVALVAFAGGLAGGRLFHRLSRPLRERALATGLLLQSATNVHSVFVRLGFDRVDPFLTDSLEPLLNVLEPGTSVAAAFLLSVVLPFGIGGIDWASDRIYILTSSAVVAEWSRPVGGLALGVLAREARWFGGRSTIPFILGALSSGLVPSLYDLSDVTFPASVPLIQIASVVLFGLAAVRSWTRPDRVEHLGTVTQTAPSEQASGGPGFIGRFKVSRQLGSGGMGTVLLASDPTLNRLVAIKIMRHALRDDSSLRRRFEAEAKMLARLAHPNIVGIYEYGRDGDDQFIVMEYVEGESLHEILANRRQLSLAQKLRILDDVCAGVQHAHNSGVLHRDLKPSNVIVQAEAVPPRFWI